MTYEEIRFAWNAQADDEKLWNSLTEAEKVEWAAIIAAAKARGPWPVTVVLPEPVGALARDKDGVRISFHPGCTDKVRLRASLEEGLTGGPYRTEYVFSESQMRAFVLSERAARKKAQEEVVALKERIARAGVEHRRALHEALQQEREVCAQVLEAALKVVSDALNDLVEACHGHDGKLKTPDKKELMRARSMLPPRCSYTLTKKI